ncbi:hypothetical protein HFN84_37305 [Rhizobium laguerreae]|uniref:hypothetical protein n=1 Tax=Rhizobium laguerreae TaxID=1076926 RepID=UPI001C9167D4|nr:hypothetical protein [Rhizobium laguerreae]MBY3390858.1 hypothetical protein [Rhizobium laguerreae]MBY3404571.1 hypothetical protein [Rhizobium laguerreae]MBY3411471.1 hypothetical protein [Rhizobium laguerreae]MBY3432525.1 hypothetical protein [Rhizobium laguerreae]MBY3441019.1 hypothetical protein [Rhizobium laguerreae]
MFDLESDCYRFWENLDCGGGRVGPRNPLVPVLARQKAACSKGQGNDLMLYRIKSLGQLDAESDGLTLACQSASKIGSDAFLMTISFTLRRLIVPEEDPAWHAHTFAF